MSWSPCQQQQGSHSSLPYNSDVWSCLRGWIQWMQHPEVLSSWNAVHLPHVAN